MRLVQKYIDAEYPAFQSSDKVRDVLTKLEELGLQSAPVLKQGKLYGFVCPDGLLRAACMDGDMELEQLHKQGMLKGPRSVGKSEHILDVFGRLEEHPLCNLLPVAEDKGAYAGVVEKRVLLREIASLFHFSEKGATIEIEVPALGTKISEIVGVIEKNDAMVLSFGVTEPDPGAQTMTLTFRVQSPDLFRLVKNLEKYGYVIPFVQPSAEGAVDELREKALEFMRYIDM